MNPQEQPKTDRDIKDIKVATDFPKFIFGVLSDQIKQADTKAVGVLGIIGIVTGALLSRLNSLKSTMGTDDLIWIGIFAFSVIMIVLTMKFIIRVIYPRDSKISKKPEQRNMIYFKDIASYSAEEFIQRGQEMDNAKILNETYADVYNLAKVATKKYAALRHAMSMAIITIIWTIGVLLFS